MKLDIQRFGGRGASSKKYDVVIAKLDVQKKGNEYIVFDNKKIKKI